MQTVWHLESGLGCEVCQTSYISLIEDLMGFGVSYAPLCSQLFEQLKEWKSTDLLCTTSKQRFIYQENEDDNIAELYLSFHLRKGFFFETWSLQTIGAS